MQALNIAQREGLKIPLSDKPVSDFDLVKAFQEREKEKQQEVERIKEAAELKTNKGRGIKGLVVGTYGELTEEDNHKSEKVGHDAKTNSENKLDHEFVNPRFVSDESIQLEERSETHVYNNVNNDNNGNVNSYL